MSSVANRYGTPKRKLSGRTKLVMVIVGLLVGIGGALWLSVANSKPVTFNDISFEIPSNTSTVVVVEVTKKASDEVQCSVRALNESKAIVGFKTLSIPATEGSGQITSRYTVNLRTESLATTGGIEACKVIG